MRTGTTATLRWSGRARCRPMCSWLARCCRGRRARCPRTSRCPSVFMCCCLIHAGSGCLAVVCCCVQVRCFICAVSGLVRTCSSYPQDMVRCSFGGDATLLPGALLAPPAWQRYASPCSQLQGLRCSAAGDAGGRAGRRGICVAGHAVHVWVGGLPAHRRGPGRAAAARHLEAGARRPAGQHHNFRAAAGAQRPCAPWNLVQKPWGAFGALQAVGTLVMP